MDGRHGNANANANLLPRPHPGEPSAKAAHPAHANCNDILIRQQLSCPIQWVTQERNWPPEAVVTTILWGMSLQLVIKPWPGSGASRSLVFTITSKAKIHETYDIVFVYK